MITIRHETPDDYTTVENIIRQSFYNVYMPGCYEHYLAHIIRQHEDFIHELDFVLEKDGKIIGQIMYTKAKLIDENKNEIEISMRLFNLITEFQNTVHNTAITYHRKLRDKEITKSELDNIKGIGEKKKNILLKKFGSVQKIKEASIDEISDTKGIDKELAKKIKNNL